MGTSQDIPCAPSFYEKVSAEMTKASKSCGSQSFRRSHRKQKNIPNSANKSTRSQQGSKQFSQRQERQEKKFSSQKKYTQKRLETEKEWAKQVMRVQDQKEIWWTDFEGEESNSEIRLDSCEEQDQHIIVNIEE